MANTTLATVKTNELSVKGAESLRDSVKKGLALVNKGYLSITPDVAKLYDCKGYKALGYKNFDEMCTLEFGMSHGTTVGIRKVFERFGTVSKENKYSIPEKYTEYGYTKLLLFTDKKFAETGIDPIAEFTPDMTIAEMKDALKLKLEDKADKQDKTAIDTTAEEVAENTSAENTSAENTSAEGEFEDAPEGYMVDYFQLPYLDRSSCAIELIKTMQGEAKEKGLRPEKMILFEGVIANLKELEKEFKKLAK
ncbi:MAG: hypothetical protein J6S85_05115 [Methanobrevibacter sp.]|nr:hypothetical protein [Methanobrevibacter sp.]